MYQPAWCSTHLLEKLCEKGVAIPTIMTSAYADVPMAVQAMSSGILDFMEKPFSRQALLARIREAIDRDACRLREKARRAEVAARLATLSPREHEVMDWLVAGKHTKQIAHDLGISAQTVARHRLRVLSKMQVESVAELIHLVLTFTLTRT